MKIDVTKIEGYENMSAEEKLKALEAYDVPDPDYSGYVKKSVFDKTASDLAAKKKELDAHLSEEEKKQREQAEANAELQKNYETLLRESQISKMIAKYLALGYEDALAEETATAYVDGDTETVFANQKKAIDALTKSIRKDALKGTPRPDGGDGGNTMTKEKLSKMDSTERIAWAMKNQEAYETIMGGTE